MGTRRIARAALALVVLMGGLMALPRPASRVIIPDASAQVPTPTVPDIISSPTPKKTPTPTPSQSSGGGGSGGSGGGSGPGGGAGGGKKDRDGDGKPDSKDGKGGRNKKNKKKKKDELSIFEGTFQPTGPKGSFNTDKLLAIASQLRALGWDQSDVIRRVYPPWIIAGPAAWTNTWGAPRVGPGPLIRTHEGQDVFCTYGDPVLAPSEGTVSFSDGGLGGTTARVHMSDGRYWYLTHLSALNTDQFGTGDRVQAGAIVGYCGNSGNALTTPPHVHVGLYRPVVAVKTFEDAIAGSLAENPMRRLIELLRSAERHAKGLIAKTLGKRVEQQPRLTAQRRFGDGLIPSRSELRVATEALWASGASPASGAFGLAETTLQAALAERVAAAVFQTNALEAAEGAGNGDGLDPNSALARLLRDSRRRSGEGSD